MTDRILTLHPEGKRGVRIEQARYEAVRGAILAAVQEGGEISFLELVDAVRERIGGAFDGSVTWHVTTIKLDLEALVELIRARKGGRQVLRRA